MGSVVSPFFTIQPMYGKIRFFLAWSQCPGVGRIARDWSTSFFFFQEPTEPGTTTEVVGSIFGQLGFVCQVPTKLGTTKEDVG